MSTSIRNLAPKEVWNMFADLNAVPRPSKKEERVIQFMVDFGKKLNLETFVDKVGNVIITKPAGLVIITLPTLSTNVSKFSFLPKSTIN